MEIKGSGNRIVKRGGTVEIRVKMQRCNEMRGKNEGTMDGMQSARERK